MKKYQLVLLNTVLLFILLFNFFIPQKAFSITATYSDANSFTVSGDLTDQFPVGIRVICCECSNCPSSCTDAQKHYGTVSSRSYSSPDTTINLTSGSDDIDSDLVAVVYANISVGSSGTLPAHTHAGEGQGGASLGNITVSSLHLSGTLYLDANGTVQMFSYEGSIADDGSIDLPSATAGGGKVYFDEAAEWAEFSFTDAAVVTLWESTDSVINSDTDAYYCIFDNGTSVRIRNRIGSSKNIKVTVDCN